MIAAQRLRGRRRIASIRAEGLLARAGVVRVRAVPGQASHARAAVAVVGTRSAVQRNRARRRVRAALTSVLAASAPVDVVLRVGADAATCPFTELEDTVERAVAGAVAAVHAA